MQVHCQLSLTAFIGGAMPALLVELVIWPLEVVLKDDS